MVGAATKTVEQGDDIELKVTKGASLSNDQIQWSASNSSALVFENGIKSGTQVEVQALKVGTYKCIDYELDWSYLGE